MIVGPSRGVGRSEVLYHEYVHHLLREQVTFPLPRWYDEGWADVLATMEIKGKKVTFGTPNKGRLDTIGFLGKLRLEQLLSSGIDYDQGISTARYYSTSWLFMHYLQLSRDKTVLNLGEKVGRYLYAINNGEDPVTAFEPNFGMTMEEMDRKLLGYQNKQSFTVYNLKLDFNAPPISSSVKTRSSAALNSKWAALVGDSAVAFINDVSSTSIVVSHQGGYFNQQNHYEQANQSLQFGTRPRPSRR